MGSSWSANTQPLKVPMFGLDGSGKTTLLYRLKLGKPVEATASVGFNIEVIQGNQGVPLQVWDIGGSEKMRSVWRHYFDTVAGLIFVVDSTDPARFDEAAASLAALLHDPLLHGASVLIFANKQDLPDAQPPADVARALRLATYHIRWHIGASTATDVRSLKDGLNWLSSETLNPKPP